MDRMPLLTNGWIFVFCVHKLSFDRYSRNQISVHTILIDFLASMMIATNHNSYIQPRDSSYASCKLVLKIAILACSPLRVYAAHTEKINVFLKSWLVPWRYSFPKGGWLIRVFPKWNSPFTSTCYWIWGNSMTKKVLSCNSTYCHKVSDHHYHN
jgi:hypothetical protein